jgi:hypothetical protein
MAIYRVRTAKGGGFTIQAELNVGGVKLKSDVFTAKDKDHLRQQAQNLALMVKSQRLALSGRRIAQVNPGEEKI